MTRQVPLRDHRDPVRPFPEAVADIHCAKPRAKFYGDLGSQSDLAAELYDEGARLALAAIFDHAQAQAKRILATMHRPGNGPDGISDGFADLRSVLDDIKYDADERDIQRATIKGRKR